MISNRYCSKSDNDWLVELGGNLRERPGTGRCVLLIKLPRQPPTGNQPIEILLLNLLEGGLHELIKMQAGMFDKSDLAEDLRQWVESKQGLQNGVLTLEVKRKGLPPLTTPVFTVPKQMVKVLDLDLVVADIPKTDDRGRTVDFHSLRHTFGTLLSVGGADVVQSDFEFSEPAGNRN